jgi:conjugal transfer pilus assembly protein TraB
MSDLSPTSQAKRKQVTLMVSIIGGIVLLSALGVWLTQDSAPPPDATRSTDIKTKSYIAPGEKIDPHDAWRGVADTRLNTMENRMAALENENKDLKRKLDEKSSKGGADKSSAPERMSDDDLDKRLKEYEKSVEGKKDYPGGTPSNPQPGQAGARTGAANQAGNRQPGTGKPSAPNPKEVPQDVGVGILTVKLRNPNADPMMKTGLGASHSSSGASGANADPKNVPKTTQNYLPSGMFGQAVVLSGLDAPTGGQAQSNPHPVLLQLRDLAVLPNKYRYDWKNCMITGAGYGDISSERAYIRTESLSCVSKDGKVLDVPIKGYIAGEDGKAGMRGRLVSKQGQALANGLLAGVVSGIGTGLERSSTIQSVSPLGSTTTVKSGDEYKAGIGSGVGRALDRLANYYISLAEKMFPVIEIDAGRVVDVVLTKGVLVDVDFQQQQ